MTRFPLQSWILGAATLMGLALTACAPTTVSMREGTREYVATDYEDVLDRWTRTDDLVALSKLNTLLRTTATFEHWDFRWAYVIRYAEDYRLTIDQRKKLLDQTLEESRTSHHFFIAITGGERRFNDLTKPDSAWIVRLIDSTGSETAPEEIVAIKRPNAIEKTYYPYITGFHQVFRLKFPVIRADGRPSLSPEAEWVGLRIAGAQGNTELAWVLDRDAPPAEGIRAPVSPAREPNDSPSPPLAASAAPSAP